MQNDKGYHMTIFFKKRLLVVVFMHFCAITYSSAGGLIVVDEDLSSQAEQVTKSFNAQIKDLALSPAPRQQRPFLYKLTPPEGLKELKEFVLLGTNHTYPYFMMPYSVLKAVSKAERFITELGHGYEDEDRPITYQELQESGLFLDLASETERLVKKEGEFWSSWYDEQIIKELTDYTQEKKITFLEDWQAKDRLKITNFLADWSGSFSNEERQYILSLFEDKELELTITDLNKLHPAAVDKVITLIERAQDQTREIRGMDASLIEYAQSSSKPNYALDTIDLRSDSDFTEFKEERDSLTFGAIQYFVNHIMNFAKNRHKKNSFSFIQDMVRSPIFRDYHDGIILVENISPSITTDLRTQAWLPKIEEYIRLKGTFIAVGLAHVPDILAWTENKGYTVKRSKH